MFNSPACTKSLARLVGNPYFEEVMQSVRSERDDALDRLVRSDPSSAVSVAKVQQTILVLENLIAAVDAAAQLAKSGFSGVPQR